MKVQTLNSTNYNNNVNFRQKIVPTKFLEKTLNNAIERPACHRKLYDSILKILNDGKNDVVKFDYAKGKLLQKILPGSYCITVNGKQEPWNCFFGALGTENQCEYAINDYAKDIDVEVTSEKLDRIRNRHEQAWHELVKHKCYDMDAKKAEKYMIKKVDYLKKLYNKTLSEEFQKIKNLIFKPE